MDAEDLSRDIADRLAEAERQLEDVERQLEDIETELAAREAASPVWSGGGGVFTFLLWRLLSK